MTMPIRQRRTIEGAGLGKATVYRLFPTKDALIGAYLERLAATVLAKIDADVERCAGDPAAALRAVLTAIRADVGRPGFRGCAFNNASIEFPDPAHPARAAARAYRAGLRERLVALAAQLRPGPSGTALGEQLAVLVDGMYTNAAHLGAAGPAAAGADLPNAWSPTPPGPRAETHARREPIEGPPALPARARLVRPDGGRAEIAGADPAGRRAARRPGRDRPRPRGARPAPRRPDLGP